MNQDQRSVGRQHDRTDDRDSPPDKRADIACERNSQPSCADGCNGRQAIPYSPRQQLPRGQGCYRGSGSRATELTGHGDTVLTEQDRSSSPEIFEAQFLLRFIECDKEIQFSRR